MITINKIIKLKHKNQTSLKSNLFLCCTCLAVCCNSATEYLAHEGALLKQTVEQVKQKNETLFSEGLKLNLKMTYFCMSGT